MILIYNENHSLLTPDTLPTEVLAGHTVFFQHHKVKVAICYKDKLYVTVKPPMQSPEVLDCMVILAGILPIDSVLEAYQNI